MAIEKGALVFALSQKDSWKTGFVEKWDGKAATVKCKDGEVLTKLPEDSMLQVDDAVLQEDVHDLLNLTLLHDSTLLHVLKERYMRDVIYTNIGAIVIALNPFNFKIPWYIDAKMPDYLIEGDTIERNIPHSWAVAHNTYMELRNDEENQTILVSGESGAGKTEASKIVMKYLAAKSCMKGEQNDKDAAALVGTKINMASPPLESYGNAKTVRNDNSSRFGKFTKVKFDGQGFLRGAHITKYLLEKSRIVTASVGERVYHSFYLCVRGAESQHKLAQDKTYRSLNAGMTLNNKEFDTQEEYKEVNDALDKMGLDKGSVVLMWAVVAGVLHILNLDYTDQGEGSKIKDGTEGFMDLCCEQWRIEKGIFLKEACKSEMNIGGQQVIKLLSPVKARDGRDSLVKTLYDELFQWLIDKCNELLDIPEDGGNWVGLLDIFGFEDFEVNSFEQVCINLANESLQGHYNEYIFTRDMNMCRAEGIDVTEVIFPDNSDCIKLVAGVRPPGVLAMLDEECSLGKGTDMGFLDKAAHSHKKNPFFLKKQLAKNSFIVHHYAGSVSYTVDGMLDKNRDTLKDSFKHMMRASSEPFIAALIPEPDDGSGKSAKKLTVGAFFKQQVAMLMEVINSTNPHWIRCVKPHPAKKPLMVSGVQTMKQLASSGVLGTVKIRKAGYPVRMSFLQFKQRYKVIAESVGCDMSDVHAVGQAIFKVAQFGTNRGQLGKSIVFLKSEGYIDLEKLKKKYLATYARTLVMAAHRRNARRRLAIQRKIASVELIQAFCYSKPSEKKWRTLEYETKKDVIIAAVKKVIQATIDEETRRKEIRAEEEAALKSLIASLADGFKKIEAAIKAAKIEAERKWHASKPERDRKERDEVEREEEDARSAVLSDEDAAWRGLWADIERERDMVEQLEFEREEQERLAEERAESEEREKQRRLEEARVAAERAAERIRIEEQREMALRVWRESEVVSARQREEKRREKEEKERESRVRQAETASADELREMERAHIIRTRAQYPEQRFDAGPGVNRQRAAWRDDAAAAADAAVSASAASPAASPQRRAAAQTTPRGAACSLAGSRRGYASPSRERSAPRSIPRSDGGSEYASVAPPDPVAAKQRASQARLTPGAESSLQAVARLRRLRELKSPGLIVSPKIGIRDTRNPENPSNPNWKPPEDGTVLLPDGTRVNLAEYQQRLEDEKNPGRRRPGRASAGK